MLYCPPVGTKLLSLSGEAKGKLNILLLYCEGNLILFQCDK